MQNSYARSGLAAAPAHRMIGLTHIPLDCCSIVSYTFPLVIQTTGTPEHRGISSQLSWKYNDATKILGDKPTHVV
jgi:hypothetical protein